jgi:hypothetical protein
MNEFDKAVNGVPMLEELQCSSFVKNTEQLKYAFDIIWMTLLLQV